MARRRYTFTYDTDSEEGTLEVNIIVDRRAHIASIELPFPQVIPAYDELSVSWEELAQTQPMKEVSSGKA